MAILRSVDDEYSSLIRQLFWYSALSETEALDRAQVTLTHTLTVTTALTKQIARNTAIVTLLLVPTLAYANDDPFESINREILEFNDAADAAILRPIAVAYDDTVPMPIRRALMNAYDNLTDINGALNAVLQGRPGRAAKNTGRVW